MMSSLDEGDAFLHEIEVEVRAALRYPPSFSAVRNVASPRDLPVHNG
jgi:hypothetical protein